MGSKVGSPNGPDWRDVARCWEALETSWQQPIKLTVMRIGSGKFAQLALLMEMVMDHSENGELRPSAFVQSSTGGNGATALEGELLALLYRLDFIRSEKPYSMAPDSA